MTAAQVIHFLIVIGLGILAFITFIVAATILGLMIVEDCHYCVQYPVGLYVLGILAVLFLISIVRALIDGPYFTWEWLRRNQEALILALLILLVLIIIL